MASCAPAFSARFVRATEAERARLGARLEAAKARARADKGRLAAAEAEVGELESRLGALAGLPGAPPPEPAEPAPARVPQLRGAAIREVAVEALFRRGADAGPIHYRLWLLETEARGGPVAGKRPEAVFLNQVTRHPLVRSTTKRGFYELDPGAAGRLGARVAELRSSLAAATASEAGEPAAPRRRRRSHELSIELSRAERELGEALQALPVGAGDGAR